MGWDTGRFAHESLVHPVPAGPWPGRSWRSGFTGPRGRRRVSSHLRRSSDRWAWPCTPPAPPGGPRVVGDGAPHQEPRPCVRVRGAPACAPGGCSAIGWPASAHARPVRARGGRLRSS